MKHLLRFFRRLPTILRSLASVFRQQLRDESSILYCKTDPLGDSVYEANHEWVSRHHIAEGDLICPRCRGVAAVRGDFSRVVKHCFPNGVVNEAVKCACMVKSNGIERRCGIILYASPDTEHGDHLVEGTVPPDFYLFRRVSPLTAAQECFGEDVIQIDTDTEQVVVAPNQPPIPVKE